MASFLSLFLSQNALFQGFHWKDWLRLDKNNMFMKKPLLTKMSYFQIMMSEE